MKEASDPSSPATPRSHPRRTRWSSSSSSASSSLSTPSPSPSSYHHVHCSPLSSSVIPFSWEHRPGVPKSATAATAVAQPQLLPLPPTLRSNSVPVTTVNRKKRGETTSVDHQLSVDPFAAALEECAKATPAPPTPSDLKDFWRRSAAVSRRPVTALLADRLGLFFAVHGACKQASCSVSHATTVRLPRRPRT